MWNGSEWWTFIKGILKGIAWGIGVVVFLLLYAGFAETWNCFCEFFCNGDFSLPMINSDLVVVFGFIIAFVINVVIGIVSATSDCRYRRENEKNVEEEGNHKSICSRLVEVSRDFNALQAELDRHGNSVSFIGVDYHESISEQIQDSENQYRETLEVYKKHTQIQGKGESV